MNTHELIDIQREYFKLGETLSLDFRIHYLCKLQHEIRRRKNDIDVALKQDLGRASYENYMVETGFTLSELEYTIKKLPRWAKDKYVKTPLAAFPSYGLVKNEPYGCCLIMSPWNYPFQLAMVPLIGAIASGNCAVVKPSAYAGATSDIIREIISDCFLPEHVCVIEGGREENKLLLEEKFDFIFFTGSPAVGKEVMEKASQNLTPVCLELGGKSPVIVDETAKIPLTARRIVFGKFLNAGQTCVAPDYVFVHKSVQDQLIEEMIRYIKAFFDDNALKSSEYPKIINEKHFNRLNSLLKNQNIVFGGGNDGESRIEPTILNDVDTESSVMQGEIFGPILPIISYDDISYPIKFIKNRDKPLALYLFTSDKDTENIILNELSFGGGCVNDTIMHLSTNKLPFGGVGASGMGNYHGRYSFETFSHAKGILKSCTCMDMPLRYHPYTKTKKWVMDKYWK